MQKNYSKLRRAAQAGKFDAAVREIETKDVFVAGPYIDVGLPITDDVNSSTDAKKARYMLCRELSDKGHNVYLGEDGVLRDLGERHYGKYANAVLYEKHYIKNHIDAVIVFPSSPGSFCEVGDWVGDSEICPNMMLIIDKKYEEHRNYLNDGVVRMARLNYARVEYVEYKNYEEVSLTCDDFIEMIAAKHRMEHLYGRR